MVNSEKLNKIPQNNNPAPEVDNYIVLGERIDQELREKIREAIMSTRLASGGTGNPFVTRSVFKAESNCNKVLGRLNAPFHKRYRRDILLSMIRMHERNKQWVNAAKTYDVISKSLLQTRLILLKIMKMLPAFLICRLDYSVTKWLEEQARPQLFRNSYQIGQNLQAPWCTQYG